MKPIVFLRIIFVQVVLAVIGSLYFSNFGDPIANTLQGHIFGGSGFEPCHLCRWARILMYPLLIISFVGLLRKDTKIVYTILPFSIAGLVLTGYHYSMQYINALNVFTCVPGNPCTTIDRKIFGIVTIPALAWLAFLLITLCAIAILIKDKKYT
ncbi:MAG TPA: disulfide bond formation protein B [Candidatus Absconditabacterales bacterium]|nr:disulfide bond formation protein B [Candidatus Absconditabacterales bacterium]